MHLDHLVSNDGFESFGLLRTETPCWSSSSHKAMKHAASEDKMRSLLATISSMPYLPG